MQKKEPPMEEPRANVLAHEGATKPAEVERVGGRIARKRFVPALIGLFVAGAAVGLAVGFEWEAARLEQKMNELVGRNRDLDSSVQSLQNKNRELAQQNATLSVIGATATDLRGKLQDINKSLETQRSELSRVSGDLAAVRLRNERYENSIKKILSSRRGQQGQALADKLIQSINAADPGWEGDRDVRVSGRPKEETDRTAAIKVATICSISQESFFACAKSHATRSFTSGRCTALAAVMM
jgi:hypothetical protein